MNDIAWSNDGWTVYVFQDLENGYVRHQYRVKIQHDWMQPWENYIYLGGEAFLEEKGK